MSWTPALPEAGRWKVYARWTNHANRATDAPYRVHHAGGVTTVRVNQELDGGQWLYLGIFDLDPAQGHRVVLGDDADEYVIGDAVKFLRDAAAAPAEEVMVDNSAATLAGAWTASSGAPGYRGSGFHPSAADVGRLIVLGYCEIRPNRVKQTRHGLRSRAARRWRRWHALFRCVRSGTMVPQRNAVRGDLG